MRVLIIMLLLGIGGCSRALPVSEAAPGLVTDHTIVVQGITRSYDYYVPEGLGSTSVPLVFLLDGLDGLNI